MGCGPASTCRPTCSRSPSGSGSTATTSPRRSSGAAVGRARRAAALVDRSAEPGDEVTQFEALTAAAYSELARQQVQVAVIEAGLGGRYDATNVIPSSVTVLTGVGLGAHALAGPDDRRHRDREGRRAAARARRSCSAPIWIPMRSRWRSRVAAEREATIVEAGIDPGVPVGAPGAYQRRNFALARAAAQAYLGGANWTSRRCARPRRPCACQDACSRSTPSH